VTVPGDHIYDFPERYDGTTPLPLLIALHANNNPYTQLQNLTNGSKLASDFVRVFPKSAGQGWVLGTDTPRLDEIFDEVLASYCVDTSRVFLTGHSSGAQMAVQMLCAGDERFKAVAPVAASKYCQSISPIPVMYIQGQMDAQRGNGNGSDVVAFFTSSNSCQDNSIPVTSVASCKSTFDQASVTPGCVAYQGCSAPTIWCSHDDNGYNATDGRMHGWPCFASSAMADFFSSLP
jgi:poly(3-hydroxybutyrate) depolymerase